MSSPGTAPRRLAASLAALGITAGAVVGIAGPASAAGVIDGYCVQGDLCLYWDVDLAEHGSAKITFSGNIEDYGNLRFPYNGQGGGERVKNNVASALNYDDRCSVVIYYNENYNAGAPGPAQSFAPGDSGNLHPALKNNNASHQWFC